MRTFVVLSFLLIPAQGFAQGLGGAFFQLSFTEVDAVTGQPVANPTGTLVPGEAALVTISLGFEPPVGTIVTNVPSLPPGVWEVHALHASRAFGIGSVWGGEWQSAELLPGWDAPAPPPPSPGAIHGMSVLGITAGQLPQSADQSNPVAVWQGIWMPPHYTPHMARFGVASQMHPSLVSTTVWLHDTSSPGSYFFRALMPTNQATMNIPIVPAPGPFALGLAALGLACRRRRR